MCVEQSEFIVEFFTVTTKKGDEKYKFNSRKLFITLLNFNFNLISKQIF